EGNRVAIFPASTDGVVVTPTRAMGMSGAARIDLNNVQGAIVTVAERLIEDLLSASRLMYAARALGAANLSFEMVVAYVKERKQFNQPVGRFQAIQHKLAN